MQSLKGKEIEPNLVRQVLESFDLKQLAFQEYLKDKLDPNDYHRFMLADDPLQVFLMSWPPQFFFPIHQHKNFWGFVVPLRGILSETIYGYAPNKRKVFIHPTKSFKEGEIIYEPFNVIHKLQNTSPLDQLITLHVYAPPVYGFKDTLIFDAKNRRMAVLNDKATDISWNLPTDQYEKIEENAYDLEKLW